MDSLLTEYTKNENNIFQSELWDKYQLALGNKTFWVSCNDDKILLIKLPLYKDKFYLYAPRAPKLSASDWHLFVNKSAEIAKQENCIFLRVEPFVTPNGVLSELKFKNVKKYSPLSKQFSPMNTSLLDISREEDVILEEMKPKWRYNIKLAERKGVTVRQSLNPADLAVFHKLSTGMVKRGYHSFGLEHYQKQIEALGKEHIQMFVAEEGGEILSVIIVTFFEKVATYLHGASSDNKRDLMPNHLAQWEAIKEARRRGCEIYDFWGTAPEGDEKHEWAGITRFKLGFGGEQVSFLGAFDYTFSKFWYIIFCLANYFRKLIKK